MAIIVKNMESTNGNIIPNQFVIKLNGNTYFQSYSTAIARISGDKKITLSKDWDYSVTTSKYLYKFINDYTQYTVQNKKDVQRLINDGIFKIGKVAI